MEVDYGVIHGVVFPVSELREWESGRGLPHSKTLARVIERADEFLDIFGSFDFFVEPGEAFADEREKAFAINLQVMRGDHGGIDRLFQQFLLGVFGKRRVVLLQKAAFAGNGFDDALVFKFAVSLRDGVAIDAHFFRKLAHRWQRLPGAQNSRSSRITNLIDQLQINWFARFEIDLKYHLS
ncbi:MAG: hypothetical protein ACXWC8_13570 [Limisphaerales bacterium]